MEVRIERSGGFAAFPVTEARLSGAELSPDERQRLERLVELALASEGTQGPDAFRYTLTIEREGDRRAAVVNEAGAPAELRELLHWATKRGR